VNSGTIPHHCLLKLVPEEKLITGEVERMIRIESKIKKSLFPTFWKKASHWRIPFSQYLNHISQLNWDTTQPHQYTT